MKKTVVRIVQRKRLADKAGGMAEQIYRYRIKLLPVFVMLASIAGLVYLRVQPQASKQISRLVELSSGEVSRLSLLWSPLAGMITISVAALLYMWMDYQHHKKPLIRVSPKTKYGFLHHLRTTFLPRFKYRWRPTFYWLAVAVVCAMAFIATIAFVGVPSAKAFSGDGLGTEGTPYIITSCEQLQEMRDDLTGHYELGEPIDCTGTGGWNSGAGFAPIGTSNSPFAGVLDGKGFTIDGLSQINTESGNSGIATGLFGMIEGGTLTDFNLTNVSFSAEEAGYVAATLAGGIISTTISNISVSGAVTVNTTADSSFAGGLAAQVVSSTVSQISADLTITHNVLQPDDEKPGITAGLFGIMMESTLTNSYVKGSLTQHIGGTGDDNAMIGAIVGQAIRGSIQNSYSAMSLTMEAPGGEQGEVVLMGGLAGVMSGTEVNNTFVTGAQGVSGNFERTMQGALAGAVIYMPGDENFGQNVSGTDSYVDASRIGHGACVGGSMDGNFDNPGGPGPVPSGFCTIVNAGNSQPNYFFNTSISPPFKVGSTQVWDFTNVWKIVASSTPIFISQAPGVPALPGQVRNLTTTSSDATSLTAQWLVPSSNGNSPITDYVVQYKLHSTGSWTGVTRGSPSATSQLITGLVGGQLYDVRVAAVNAVGQSDWQVTENVQTSQLPSAPRNVVASGVAESAQFEPYYFPKLDWQTPETGAPITDYVIQYRPNPGRDWDSMADDLQEFPWAANGGAWTTAYEGVSTNLSQSFASDAAIDDDDLAAALVYAVWGETRTIDSIDFRVAAVNSHGQGAWSSAQNFQIFIGITDCQQMHDVLEDWNGSVFHLLNNVDCDGTRSWNGGRGWDPIGDSASPFQGILDGKGYAILNLYINDTNQDEMHKRPSALLSRTDDATIRNLNMSNVYMANSYPTDNTSAALIALASPGTVLTNISISGTVKSQDIAGGIVGGVGSYNNDFGPYTDPVTWSGLAFLGSVTTPGFAGGIVGLANVNTARLTLQDIHTNGDLVGGRSAGGIIAMNGVNTGPGVHLVDVHSTMGISSRCRDGAGGLVGAVSGAAGAVLTITDSSYDGSNNGGINCTGDDLPFFNDPTALAVGNDGELFITDTTKTGNIHKLSSNGYVITQWSTARPGDSTSEYPDTDGLVVDSQGWSYVADTTNGEIRVYNASGQFQDAWTTPTPGQMAIDSSNNIYVTSGYQLRKYSQSGVLLNTWGEEGSGPEQFGLLSDVAIMPNGKIIVVDGQNHCLHVLLSNGDYDQKIVTDGVGAPPMTQSAPQSVAVDAQGKIYVLETDRVLVFDNTYYFLGYWGPGGIGDAEIIGSDIVAAPSSGVYIVGKTIRQYDDSGNLSVAGEFGGYVLGTPGESYPGFAGGIVGGAQAVGITITNSTSAGQITQQEGTSGGLVGFATYYVSVNAADPEASLSQGLVVTNASSSMGITVQQSSVSFSGGLVGSATLLDITGSHATGSITVDDGNQAERGVSGTVGGLVGGATGDNSLTSALRIQDSYATGDIDFSAVSPVDDTLGGPVAGGVVGMIIGWSKLDGVYATGDVAVAVNQACQPDECDNMATLAGGMVGTVIAVSQTAPPSVLRDSYATGAVSIDGQQAIGVLGGLVGSLQGYGHTVQDVYATGSVGLADDYIAQEDTLVRSGGLMGSVSTSGAVTISRTHATGAVTGQGYYANQNGVAGSGGLLGVASGQVTVQQSYATGVVQAGYALGGLIGVSSTIGSGAARVTLTDTYATGAVSGTVTTLTYDDHGGYIELGATVGGLVGVADHTDIASSYASGILSNEQPEFAPETPESAKVGYNSSTGGLVGGSSLTDVTGNPSFKSTIINSFSAAMIPNTSNTNEGAIIGRFIHVFNEGQGTITPDEADALLVNNYYDASRTGDNPCGNWQEAEMPADQDAENVITTSVYNNIATCHPINANNQTPNYFKNSATSPPLDTWDFGTPIWYSHVATYPTFQQGETVPGPPRNLAGAPTTSSVALSWEAPSSDGGSPIVNYRVQYRVHGTNTWAEYSHPESIATNYTITGLASGTSYDFQVSAINAVGQSTWVLGIYDVLVPGNPTNPTDPTIPTTPTNPTSPTGPTRPTTRPSPGGGTATSNNGGSPTQEESELLDISKIPEADLPPTFATLDRKPRVSYIPYFFLSWLLLLAAYYGYRAAKEYRYQKAAAALIDRTTKTEKSVSDFLAITTHYLGTPLSILKGAIELIASKHALQAEFMTAFNTKLKALQLTADTLTTQNEQALDAGQAVAATDIERADSRKQLWLSLAGIAVILVVTDIALMLSKSYNQTWGRTLNHVLWAVFGMAAVVVGFAAWSKQKKLRAQYHQTLDRERTLLLQKNAFLAEAAQQLTTHAHELRRGTQGLEQFPDTKLLMNGLAMLDKVSVALGKVRQFSTINDSLPSLNVKEIFTRDLAPALIQEAQTNGIKLTNALTDGVTTQMQPEELQQILRSVTQNAIQFSASGSTVGVSSQASHSATKIIVQDQGKGISAEAQQHLFEPLTRGVDTATFDHEGLGLNLYITRMILQKYGGDIQIASKEQQGTMVTMTIPTSGAVATGVATQVISPSSSA